MNKQTRTISIILIIVVLAVLVWVFSAWEKPAGKQEVAQGDPITVVLDFYDPWVKAVQSKLTDPYREELASNPILSRKLRDRLEDAEDRPEGETDPVLCQSSAPKGISARSVFEDEESAQVLVMSTQEGQYGQAAVTLNKLNGGWYIDDIECSSGERAPEREFSFEKEGHLLKDNVPAPLDPQYWHLVFEQNGQAGHTVPLFFDAESVCENADGDESTCNTDEFAETTKVIVKGEMTESGVEVKRMEF